MVRVFRLDLLDTILTLSGIRTVFAINGHFLVNSMYRHSMTAQGITCASL